MKQVISITLGIALIFGVIQYVDNKLSWQGRMQDYTDRMSRILEVSITTETLASTAAFRIPTLRDRAVINPGKRNEDDLLLGLQELGSLYDCSELSQAVSHHLSILGRVAANSDELRYHNQFMHSLPDCLPTLTNTGLVTKLTAIAEQKKQQLPLLIWAATWGSGAFNQAFGTQAKSATRLTSLESLATHPMPNQLKELAVLLTRMQNQPQEQLPKAYEQAFQALETDFYSDLVAGMLIGQEALNPISQALFSAQSHCNQPRFKPKIPVLQNLLIKIYGQEVQPYLTQLDIAAGHFLEAQEYFVLATVSELVQQKLIEQNSKSILDFIQFQEINALHQSFQQSIKNHQRAWQSLLNACNLEVDQLRKRENAAN